MRYKDLQQKLVKLGYKISKIDGKCGDETVVAIKAFQEDQKLTVDGLFGAKSLAALKNALAKIQEETSDTSWFTRNLKKGMTGDDVKILQEKLIALGYDIGASGADGKFGNKTLAAVKQFQTDHNLEADGKVGKKTIAKLS